MKRHKLGRLGEVPLALETDGSHKDSCQSINGLWKGDCSECQSDLEEWRTDLCVENLQSHFDPNKGI
ncbi:hypothetical protein TNCV_1991191 [Trichonephila clavipes]|nr:hypothetical protein TNCV_1991191 [Trichonephila clavipes]